MLNGLPVGYPVGQTSLTQPKRRGGEICTDLCLLTHDVFVTQKKFSGTILSFFFQPEETQDLLGNPIERKVFWDTSDFTN